MKFLKTFVAAGSLLCSLGAAAGPNYQDWWWDASKDGMGFNIGHQGGVVMVSWYHFGADGKASYVLFAGALDANGTLVSDLTQASGPAPSPAYNPASVQRTVAGTGKLRFVSENSATFEYTLNGVSSSMNLTRFSAASLAPEGKYKFSGEYRMSNCTVASNNTTTNPKTFMGSGQISSNSGGVYVISMGGCDYTVNLTQTGSVLSGQGTFTCGASETGTVVFDRIRPIEGHLNVDYTAQYNAAIGCTEKGTAGAIRSDSPNVMQF